MNRYWLYVIVAGFIEIVWVSGLKHSETTLQWFGTIFALICSFVLVILANRSLPVGTVYAVFAGIGTAGTVIVEMLFFDEPFQLIKIIFILLLLTGIVGLKMITAETETSREEI